MKRAAHLVDRPGAGHVVTPKCPLRGQVHARAGGVERHAGQLGRLVLATGRGEETSRAAAAVDHAKIDLIGTQDEKIYLEFSTQQLAAMGLDISSLIQTLQAQNAIQPSGTVDAGAEKIAIRISGQFTSEESLKAINFRANGRFFRLSEIDKVHRAYVDPQHPKFQYNGAPADGVANTMDKNRTGRLL